MHFFRKAAASFLSFSYFFYFPAKSSIKYSTCSFRITNIARVGFGDWITLHFLCLHLILVRFDWMYIMSLLVAMTWQLVHRVRGKDFHKCYLTDSMTKQLWLHNFASSFRLMGALATKHKLNYQSNVTSGLAILECLFYVNSFSSFRLSVQSAK